MRCSLLIFSSLVVFALLISACGGGGAGNDDARAIAEYGLSLDVIEGGNADYTLHVQEGQTLLVEVNVERAVDLTRSFVELKYDAELITPLRVMDGGFLGVDTVLLQVTDRPDCVPVSIARIGRNPDGVNGRGIIARVEFARERFRRRNVSSSAGNPPLITGLDVDQEANTITVSWTDNNAGDTNSDQYLNGMDLFPIAANFNEGVGDPGYDACVDCNGDGTINGLDVFPLAARYDQRFDAYNVYWDLSPGMEEAFVPENGSPIAVITPVPALVTTSSPSGPCLMITSISSG